MEAPEPAFAKIVADNGREYYVRAQQTGEIKFDIGREKRELTDPAYFHLAESTTLSKQHAQIFWDITKSGFFIMNKSKNKIYVETEEVSTNQVCERPLTNMTCVMISKIRFYFLLPQDAQM